ncbi:nucleotidyltransferase family protein [Pseudoalteromonas xiamenensis]|uniref:nucleotidyltransferase family protein n=1 Tax=Pseudoalteromonas xiamenensis TaxID=882626 RepID=UPI0027E463A5|nr:nucleotidyltransferase family protein [Pseudoalteromonas xiamenensis]WMN59384.1 nucleotidyltransferase family protein [Pseudoalteromonas xiamenensis]
MKAAWQNSILSVPATMQEAIDALNNSSYKLVCLVDFQGILKGVITDGDIRRAIVAGKTINTPVDDFMCSTPITFTVKTTAYQKRRLFNQHKLLYIPVINETGQVVDIEISTSGGIQEKTNTVFLMAGGFGTRLRPLTEQCPKPLLKVGTKPILETIIESFSNSGFQNFTISVHYLADQIKTHFKDGQDFGVNLNYIEESSPLGTGGALSLLPKQNEAVILMNGDLLTKVDFRELLSYHESENAKITMCVREYEFQVPYGVINSVENKVTSIVEKPIEKYFVNAGIYVISPDVINRLIQGQPIDMPDLINNCLKKDEKVTLFPIHEYWLDIGRMADFERAQLDFIQNF